MRKQEFSSQALAPKVFFPLQRPNVLRWEISRMLLLHVTLIGTKKRGKPPKRLRRFLQAPARAWLVQEKVAGEPKSRGDRMKIRQLIQRLDQGQAQAVDILDFYSAHQMSKSKNAVHWLARWGHRLSASLFAQFYAMLWPQARLRYLPAELQKLIHEKDAESATRETAQTMAVLLQFWGTIIWFQIITSWFPSTLAVLGSLSIKNWYAAWTSAIPILILFAITLGFIWKQKGRSWTSRLLLLFLILTPYVALVGPLVYSAYSWPVVGLSLFSAKSHALAGKLWIIRKTPQRQKAFHFIFHLVLLDNILATGLLVWGIILALFKNHGVLLWGVVGGFYVVSIAWNLLFPKNWPRGGQNGWRMQEAG